LLDRRITAAVIAGLDPAIHDDVPFGTAVRSVLEAPPHGPPGQARGWRL